MTARGAVILNAAKGIAVAYSLESRRLLLDIAALVGAAPTGYHPAGPRVAAELNGKIRN